MIASTNPNPATGTRRASETGGSFAESARVLRPMEEPEIGQAVTLISRAMNLEEGGYAAQTFHQHFSCRRQEIDDGRRVFVLAGGSKIIGVVGLHHYAWGPPENVWLSWFALDPPLHGQDIASFMMDAAIAEARNHHFMKLFIETYSTPEFARARAFYAAQGFAECGALPGWLPSGASMVVFYKDLTQCPSHGVAAQ